ncbi:hypothetical protein [Domibacillus indicus]|uniref:hypothetical protein n=1 Tax=Domibacillus indicus TaxID=1437523 RepID=UPI000617FCAD|nr:hypothetical protein [Domibacillus indicus]
MQLWPENSNLGRHFDSQGRKSKIPPQAARKPPQNKKYRPKQPGNRPKIKNTAPEQRKTISKLTEIDMINKVNAFKRAS